MKQGLKRATREFLSGVAAEGETIFYHPLCKELSEKLKKPYEKIDKILPKILSAISREENGAGRGMLSVVVIDKGTGLPWPNFFTLAINLKAMKEEESKEEFFERELKTVQRIHGAPSSK